MRTWVAVLGVALGALAARPAHAAPAHAAPAHDRAAHNRAAHNRAALQREVAAAAGARDWCRALHYTLRLEELGHEPRLVFNAAELARAADDLTAARALYLELLQRDPGYAKAPLARQSVDEVSALIEARGPGASCATPPPRCGDGAVEGPEVCDDGNTASGDACSADCRRAPRCGDGVLDRNEMCDDGNALDGDHCSAACLPEAAGTERPEPEPESEPEPDAPRDGEVVVHGRRDPAPGPADTAVVVASDAAPPSAGAAVLGMSVIGGGVVVTVTGAVCTLVGPLPLLGYLFQSSAVDGSDERARRAQTAERYTYETGLKRVLLRDVRVSEEQWNGTGRVLTGVGVGLTLFGAAGIIAGSVLYRWAEEPDDGAVVLEDAP